MAWRLPRIFRSRDIVCREAVELVTAYLEDQLPARDRVRFEGHLGDCPHCTAYVEQMRTTVAVLGWAQPVPVDDETRDALVGLYRRWQAG